MDDIIKGCVDKDRRQQKALFELYYKYGLTVAMAYCSHTDEAREVLNDAFLKVFDKIKDYDPSKPFEAWFRIIVIRTAINHYRKQTNEVKWTDIDDNEKIHDIVNDEEDLLFYNGLAVIGANEKELIIIKKLIESDLFWYYIKTSSKPYSSSYFSLNGNYINNFGIFPFTEDEKEYIINENEKHILDSFFEDKYGILIP